MGLEAENWWIHSIGYDFDGKKDFIKKHCFFLRPHAIEKSVRVRWVGGKNRQSTSKKFSFDKKRFEKS